jgi:copper-binding protein NosD
VPLIVRRAVRLGLAIAAAALGALVLAPAAQASCSSTRVTSLAALASEVAAGHSACLGDGLYTGSVDLSNPSSTRAVVTQEGAAVVHGQLRLNSSHIELNGLVIENAAGTGIEADCVRIQVVGGTDIRVINSNLGPCARDAIRIAANVGRHDTAVAIQGNTLHDQRWNACTCYMRGGRFTDNLVENVGNDALELWGDSNLVRHNVFRALESDANHNDVLQTWQIASDLATGDPLTNFVFERNIVDTVIGPNSHGLMVQGGAVNHELTIRSNLFRDVGSIGILLDGATEAKVYANTFVRAGTIDTLEWKAGATGTIDSNIFYAATSAGSQPWYQDATSRVSHAFNLAWGGRLLSDETSGLNADPRFYDPDGRLDANRDNDFRILDPSSPAVDRGNPAITSRLDILGRPIFNLRVDEGAYEYAPY